MCSVNHSDPARRSVLKSIENNASHWLSKCSNRYPSVNAATGNAQPKSTKSNPAPVGVPSSTRLISLLSAMLATTGSQHTPPKPTKRAGSNTPGNEIEKWKHVEHLLSMGLWDQAEEAIVTILRGKRS